jgi:hypothetical protein
VYVFSVYVKKDVSGFALLQLDGDIWNGVTSADRPRVWLDINTGLISNSTRVLSSGVENAGNGFYRVWLSAACTTAAASNARVAITTANNGTTFVGDGTSGVFIWGAQLSDSASLDEYRYNPAAAFTSTAYYGPRFDYDPVTLAARGLLIEEQRTNSIRNNTMVGAVAGTPGTTPTNWTTVLAGLTQEVVGTGTESGITYIDIRFSGTTTATQISVFFETITGVSVTNGNTYAFSTYWRLTAGSLAGFSATGLILNGYDSGGAFLVGSVTAGSYVGSPTPSSTMSRVSRAYTGANASLAFGRPGVFFVTTIGAAVDFTLRIGLPQLELGAFSTSVIPTFGSAAATRAADVATMVGDNFANWFNAVEGSFYAEYLIPDIKQNQGAIAISDGTLNNRIIIRGGNPAIQTVFIGVDLGSTQWSGVLTAAPVNSITKSAFAYETNNIAWVRNAGAVGTDTSAIIPVVNQLRLSSDGDGTNILNGYLRRIAYFPTRLPNAQLQAVTA